MERFRKVEAKRSKMHPGGLKDWVENEKWVDVRRPKKGGGYEPCGRNDTTKGKKPVCVPSNKAKSLDKKEIKADDLLDLNPDIKRNVIPAHLTNFKLFMISKNSLFSRFFFIPPFYY